MDRDITIDIKLRFLFLCSIEVLDADLYHDRALLSNSFWAMADPEFGFPHFKGKEVEKHDFKQNGNGRVFLNYEIRDGGLISISSCR